MLSQPQSADLTSLQCPLLFCSNAAVTQAPISKRRSYVVTGLLPVRQQRHQELMNALVGGDSSDPDVLFGTPQSPYATAGTHRMGCSAPKTACFS